MVSTSAITIISVVCIVLLGIAGCILLSEYKKSSIEKISFKEALDLTNLPVITFNQGNVKLNFLLDTGSTHSQIDDRVVTSNSNIYYSIKSEESVICNGIENNKHEFAVIKIPIYLKGNLFKVDFCVNTVVGRAFDDIKKSDGVTIHGILGVDFLNKHKYIIDLEKCVAYSKK